MGTVLHNCNRATGRVSLDSYSRVSVYELLFAYVCLQVPFIEPGSEAFQATAPHNSKRPRFSVIGV